MTLVMEDIKKATHVGAASERTALICAVITSAWRTNWMHSEHSVWFALVALFRRSYTFGQTAFDIP